MVYAAAVLVTAMTAGVVPVGPRPAAAAPAGCPVAPPQSLPAAGDTPWAQQRFNPARFAPFADGRNIVVAVIDSGVDAEHPQLRGHVAAEGKDYIDAAAAGRQDCVGHGTAVASLIAAQQVTGTAFRGLAPGVTILPIRVTEQVDVQGNVTGRTAAQPEASFAAAIRYAVDHGARVINMSVVLGRDDPEVKSATAYAVARNVVVVAAVGNGHGKANAADTDESGAKDDPALYPAAYDGVIGVGAIDRNGVRFEASQVGKFVDLVAPGAEITAAVPGRGYQVFNGTSMATPFVSAAAALVIQYRPDLSAREVAARLLATADPAPGGPGSHQYGAGVVNPYRALTEGISSEPPKSPAPIPAVRPDPDAEAAAAAAARTRTVALVLAAGVAGLALVVVLVAVVVPRGRQRGWRPGAG
ncbi:type VII secretion-associated serine protease mycosin [Planosporangium sp. 12N6]|uniref:type VII secretion-associated serine protease mycosin n=1 Tax=Planosporangium spinosum TaxID=3402278 RepID=UPI003CEC0361